jgi:solute carrier family 35 protein E3
MNKRSACCMPRDGASNLDMTNLPTSSMPFGKGLSGEDLKTSVIMASNVVSSIGIVLTNKWIFQHHKFTFGTLLTVVHFITTFGGLEFCRQLGMFQRKPIDIRAILGLCASFCGFVVLTNLSLQYNSVGFYQCAKVMTTPVIVAIQMMFYKTEFSMNIKSALAVVCVGVLIATVTDVELNLVGSIIAVAGVLVTSMYQIWVGTKQKDLDVDSMQLLYYQAPISAFGLLFFVPLLDDMTKLRAYEWNIPVIRDILVSCLLAFVVNISIFGIIGRTSPVVYNVVGYEFLRIFANSRGTLKRYWFLCWVSSCSTIQYCLKMSLALSLHYWESFCIAK